jgi:hypothetical protein
MENKYSNRWTPESGWVKVLARPDRPLQIAELHELQSVLNYQYQRLSSYVYGIYSPTWGLKVSVIEINDKYNILHLSQGQIYVETPHGGLYIDIAPADRIPVSKQGRVSLGFRIDFLIDDNSELLRDPLFIKGDYGAHRLVVRYRLTLNEDSYPIAVIDNRPSGGAPDVLHYRPGKLTKVYDPNIIGQAISSRVSQRWYEENGDFIANGMEVSLDQETRKLTINAGVAYIEGVRVYLPYGSYLYLPSFPSTPNTIFRYIILLNQQGTIEYYSEQDPTTYVPGLPHSTIDLATLEITNRTLIGGQFKRDISLVLSKKRSLTNADLILLSEENYRNEREMTQLLLDKQALDIGDNNLFDLSGVFTDALIDLSRSDTYHPLYNASFMPSIRALRPGFSTSIKDIVNVGLTPTALDIVARNGTPNYAMCSFSEESYIEQAKCTSWVNLGVNTRTIAHMNISPSSGPADSATIPYSAVAPSSLPTLKDNILKALSLNNDSRVSLNLNLLVREITVQCTGFQPNEDNLTLSFGNVAISQFTLLNGTLAGSSTNSIKARADGMAFLKFFIPSNLALDTYVVTLSGPRSTASAVYRSINDAIVPITTDLDSASGVLPLNTTYASSTEGWAQTFLIEEPVSITSIWLKIRSAPNLQTDNTIIAARVSIVSANGGLPTPECLAIGDLSLSDIQLSSNGSKWTEVVLDKPAFISNRGQYALVISPNLPGLELYVSTIGARSLLDGTITTTQALLNGILLSRKEGSWQPHNDMDLSFRLNKAVMANTKSELLVNIENVEPYNSVRFNMPVILPAGTNIQTYVKENGTWALVRGYEYTLQQPASTSELKVVLNNTNQMSPLLELDASTFTTIANRRSSTWISKTVEFEAAYNNIETTFEAYIPKGTSIDVLFSSNAGISWETMDMDSAATFLLDGNIPLYGYTYKALSLSDAISNISPSGASISTLRRKLTIRLDFKTADSSVIPFARRLSSITYGT